MWRIPSYIALLILPTNPIRAFSKMTDIANFAIRQSPSTTQFVTNKMCPFAQKAWIALEVSQAPYEMKEISLYGMNGKPDWFLAMNPSGTVPVLSCYGGAVVYPDSDIILDEIAKGAVEGGAKLSSDEVTVKEWRDDINKRLIPLGKQAVLSSSQPKKKELMSLLKQLNSNVKGPYLCGAEITLADCAAFPFFWRLDQEFGPLTEDTHGCGNLRTWLDTCKSTPAFAKTVQSNWWWWW